MKSLPGFVVPRTRDLSYKTHTPSSATTTTTAASSTTRKYVGEGVEGGRRGEGGRKEDGGGEGGGREGEEGGDIFPSLLPGEAQQNLDQLAQTSLKWYITLIIFIDTL